MAFSTEGLVVTDSRLDLAFVGTYPPTQCGLATFSASLRDAIHCVEPAWSSRIVRLIDGDDRGTNQDVEAVWSFRDWRSIDRALEVANNADCTILQHEFGIYPGPDGVDVVQFVDQCTSGLVVVLHTVLAEPSRRQRAIVEAVASRADAVVVQSRSAHSRLLRTHDVDARRVEVIPHGAAANLVPLSTLPRPKMLLTWGLIGPGKGIERGIRGFAAMQESYPPAVYVVCGQTHPKVLERQGERYRRSLIALADELGVGDRVVFDDEYRSWASLRAVIRHADAVLLPYDTRDQVTSGVLVEAIASGLPIVATAFPHALEQLASGAGIVVDHDDERALASALERVLYDEQAASIMRTQARRDADELLWPNVARRYCTLVESLAGRVLV